MRRSLNLTAGISVVALVAVLTFGAILSPAAAGRKCYVELLGNKPQERILCNHQWTRLI